MERDDSRQWASLAWEIHGGPMTTPEGDLVKDPQQPSGHEKIPTTDFDSCLVTYEHPPAGTDDH